MHEWELGLGFLPAPADMLHCAHARVARLSTATSLPPAPQSDKRVLHSLDLVLSEPRGQAAPQLAPSLPCNALHTRCPQLALLTACQVPMPCCCGCSSIRLKDVCRAHSGVLRGIGWMYLWMSVCDICQCEQTNCNKRHKTVIR